MHHQYSLPIESFYWIYQHFLITYVPSNNTGISLYLLLFSASFFSVKFLELFKPLSVLTLHPLLNSILSSFLLQSVRGTIFWQSHQWCSQSQWLIIGSHCTWSLRGFWQHRSLSLNTFLHIASRKPLFCFPSYLTDCFFLAFLWYFPFGLNSKWCRVQQLLSSVYSLLHILTQPQGFKYHLHANEMCMSSPELVQLAVYLAI